MTAARRRSHPRSERSTVGPMPPQLIGWNIGLPASNSSTGHGSLLGTSTGCLPTFRRGRRGYPTSSAEDNREDDLGRDHELADRGP